MAPYAAPSSLMKRSACALSTRSSAVENAVRTGEVARTATTTSAMAQRAVRWRGRAIAGDSWLIDSSPENASQAPAKPTMPVERERAHLPELVQDLVPV